MAAKSNDAKKTHPAKDNKSRPGGALTEAQQRAAVVVAETWMEKIRAADSMEAVVSANELTSLSALIAYTAHNLRVSEFRVERDLADRFNIANAKCLPTARFDDAIRYLVDRVPSPAAA